MSYTTRFEGEFACAPFLTAAQCATLCKFAEERHEPIEGTSYPESYYCPWAPNEDGTGIKWIEEEASAYHFVEWLQYIVETYLKPWGVVISGEVSYQGEEASDRGVLYARDNEIRKVDDIVRRPPNPFSD